MKKIMKKMKGKKVLSIVLAAIMIATTFNIALPMLKLGANAADITIDGVTQERIVGTDGSYVTTYDNYAAQFLNGASAPTNIVIPGLNAAQDYVIQGMTYYPKRDWMLVTAYHNADTDNGETVQSSKVFALDAATGEFAAMFSFLNPDGTANTEHGGGIACSENNIYYACGDDDRQIAYAPISAFENAVEGQHTVVQLLDMVDFNEIGSVTSDSKTAYTAYVCYDDGILWTGNFYDMGVKILGISVAATDYSVPANNDYNSMVFGYELAGNSSEAEWDYLMGFKNIDVVNPSHSATGDDNITWNATKNDGGVTISGSVDSLNGLGEITGNFGSFYLNEGVEYTIEFTSTNDKSDLYMFSPAGTHCNVKQSSDTTITPLADGRYHYKMTFTAGLKPDSADSTWPTTQSIDGTYTGTYTIRFDQDSIAAGENRSFTMSDIKITHTASQNAEVFYDGGSRGEPSYVIGLNNAIKDVQYAVVDNGKLYLSCSFGTGEGTNSVSLGGMNPYSTLVVADIDLTQPGTKSTTINTHKETNKAIKAYDIQDYKSFNMMPMSEGLCVINDKVFITFESASNKYLNEAGTFTGNCNHPIDVIWELDPYELMETVVAEPEKSIYYEKVYSHADIVDGDEYIIVYESDVKDPVTQKNYLYALNANGNFKGHELSKTSNEADNIKGYDGMIGHPISYYSFEKGVNNEDILYLEHPEEDDIESIRWTLSKNSDNSDTTKYSIKNTSTYFANYNSLYFNENKIAMAPSGAEMLANIHLGQLVTGSGGFVLSNAEKYFLWCNDGSDAARNEKANAFYAANASEYPILNGVTETPGTFHCDALLLSGDNIIDASIDKGEAVTDANERYREGVFQIYRRVVDEAASTYESRVYTDLEAELQEDGTYDITLETFAISPNHYQYRGEKKPTDYIIVADTSSSMAEKGSTGINEYTGSLSVASMSLEANTSDDNGTGVSGYGFSNPDEDIYFKHTDGKYYKAYMAVNTTELKKIVGIISSMRQKYYVYYIADDGLYYCVQDHAVNPVGRTYTEWKAWVDSGENESDYSTKTSNSNRRSEDVYVGYHYRFDDVNSSYAGEHVRLKTLTEATNNLIDQIATQNSANRIALVQYGADASSGFITTSGSLSTTDYANAFWASGTVDQLKLQVNALTTSAQTNNSGLEMDYVNALISNSGYSYKSDGTKNVAVIFISDGIPGADGGSSTTAAANAVIQKALTAKNNGAFIYSVLVGNNSVSGFNKKAYMDGVSSRYAAAESLTSLGGQSVDGVNYSISLATTTMNNFVNFGAMTTEEVANNTAVGLDNLDANSYLRQQLNDAFKFPASFNKDTDLIVELITGEYDEIGRFSFNEAGKSDNAADAATIKNATSVDTTNKTLTVTKYDYADEYVARNRTDKDGRKLRVTLKGLLADETKKIQNTSINNTNTTGIYKTETNMDNNVEFKYLPTEYFNIPEYTYVLDYGLKMLDTDVNGTLKSVSADLSAQRDENGNLAYKSESENGLVEITNENLDLLYHTTPSNFADSGYCLIQRDDGTYDWFEIKVVPASNVYFEEDDLNVKEADVSNTAKADWTDAGSDTYTQRGLDAEGDIVGYNYTYDVAGAQYSNGNALKATVSASQRNSKTQTFDFVGTGVDIVSSCSDKTGIMLVNIKNKTTGKSVAMSLVDTYCEAGEFNQTPIFNWSGAHGTYTVEISALYLSTASALNATKSVKKSNIVDTGLEMNTSASFDADALQAMLDEAGVEDVSAEDVELVWFDDNSIFNGGTGVAPTVKRTRAGERTVTELVNYIDGFRVYNPLGTTVTDDYDPYADYSDSEKNVTYANVIDNLAPVSETDGSAITSLDGIAYITGSLADGESLTFAKYQEVGPKGELYLNAGQSISFKINRATNENVMLGLRAVNGATTVKVNNTEITKGVNSATEMYYDISNCIGSGTGIIVTVQNTGSTRLAINHIKFSGDSDKNTTVASDKVRSLTRSSDATQVSENIFLPVTEADLVEIEEIMSAETIPATVKNGVVVPIVEEEEIIPDDNTTPDDNNTNDGTDTEENEKESFSISSIIEMIIAMIEKILKNAFGINNIA